MIYTDLTRKAMGIAYDAHHGQLDKAGCPYIFHPMHLAEQMSDEISCCAALLHDVVEDTDITMDFLEQEFPREVTEVLQLLTHNEDVAYLDYIRAIRANPIAVKVKLADLDHNSDQTRLPVNAVSEDRRTRLAEKYSAARKLLTGDARES